MGCIHSRPGGEDDVVRRFNARKRFMKQAVLHRHAFASAHYAYLLALKNAGSALRQFADGEAKEAASPRNGGYGGGSHLLHPPPPPPPPPPLLISAHSAAPNSRCSHRASGSFHGSSLSSPPPNPSNRSLDQQNWSPGSSPDQRSDTPPPPSPPKSAWDIFNPFRPTSPPFHLNEGSSHRHGRRSRRSNQARASAYYDNGYGEDSIHGARDADRDANTLAKWESSANQDFASAVRIDGAEKDLLEIVKDLDEQFLKAHSCGASVSKLLETRKGNFMNEVKGGNGFSSGNMFAAITHWAKNPLSGGDDIYSAEAELLMGSHALVLQRIYSWEKKLFNEVKAGEALRTEHQKKSVLLRSQEAKGEDPNVIERTRAVIKRLHSEMLVSYQGVESITAAIKKARDQELYPQLMELSEGLMYMWRTMHECHAQQKRAVLHLKSLDGWSSSGGGEAAAATTTTTSDYHHHAAVELEKEMSNWHECFCKLVSTHREYVTALTGWSRLSTMEIAVPDDGNKENDHYLVNEESSNSMPSSSSSSSHQAAVAAAAANASDAAKPPVPPTVTLCEEWQKTLDRLPDKVASEAIKSFAAVVHALVAQQSEELKQRKKVERVGKRLEKKMAELAAAEKKAAAEAEAEAEAAAAAAAAAAAMSSSSRRSDDDSGADDDFSTINNSSNFYNNNNSFYSNNNNDSESSDTETRATTEDGYSVASPRDPLTERKAAVDALKRKLESERSKHEKCVQDTRVLTLNSMQTGLPGVFEAMTGFAAVCGQAFQALYNEACSSRNCNGSSGAGGGIAGSIAAATTLQYTRQF